MVWFFRGGSVLLFCVRGFLLGLECLIFFLFVLDHIRGEGILFCLRLFRGLGFFVLALLLLLS